MEWILTEVEAGRLKLLGLKEIFEIDIAPVGIRQHP